VISRRGYVRYAIGIPGTFTAVVAIRIIGAMGKADKTIDRVIIPMRRELIERIDDFRFAHRIASRAEAIRQLIEASLPPRPRVPGKPSRSS